MRWTDQQLEDFLRAGGTAKDASEVLSADTAKPNKFGAQPGESDGFKFDSKLEEKRYHELKLRERIGEITDLEVHPSWPLAAKGVEVRYQPTKQYPAGKVAAFTADFKYRITGSDVAVIEDCKGVVTEAAKLRIAVFEALHETRVIIIRKGAKNERGV